MAGGGLTGLQERILRVLAHLSPPWTLTGGAALAAFDARHRDTRDLDLFWRNRRDLGDSVRDAAAALQAAGLLAGDNTDRCVMSDTYALYLAQRGEKHVSAKPLKGLGPGVLDVVSDRRSDTYRAVYVASSRPAASW